MRLKAAHLVLGFCQTKGVHTHPLADTIGHGPGCVFVAVLKYLDKEQLRGEKEHSAYSSRSHPITGGKSRQQEPEAAGHVTSIAESREKQMRAHQLLSFLCS